MSDAKGAGNDPSMDDILASIRKIISDDEARAQVNDGAPVTAGAPPAVPKRDDVLLLTDLVDEPKDAPPPVRPATVPPPAKIDPVSASEMPQPSIAPAAPIPPLSVVPPAPVTVAPTMPPVTAPMIPATSPVASVPPVSSSVEPIVKPPSSEPSLVEPGAAGVASSAFDRLSQAVKESVPPPAAQEPGPVVGTGGRNLEDIVKEMLRPMLKEWLDKNLPGMVERYVEREIVRLTRR